MMALPRHSVSSSVAFSPSPDGEARLFLEDQEPDGVRNQAAPMKQLRLFRWFSAIESFNLNEDSHSSHRSVSRELWQILLHQIPSAPSRLAEVDTIDPWSWGNKT